MCDNSSVMCGHVQNEAKRFLCFGLNSKLAHTSKCRNLLAFLRFTFGAVRQMMKKCAMTQRLTRIGLRLLTRPARRTWTGTTGTRQNGTLAVSTATKEVAEGWLNEADHENDAAAPHYVSQLFA